MRSAILAMAAAVLILAGCGDSASESGSAASQADATNPDVEYAREQVKKFSIAANEYPPPAESLENADSLRGKRVYYIPLTLKTSAYAVTADAIEEALGTMGVNVETCDGQSNPATIAQCLGRAVASNADGVIADSYPYALAANAFEKAKRASIPILVTNQFVPPKGVPGWVEGVGDAKLGYQPMNGVELLQRVADWVIADSNGKANVLLVKFMDSPTAQRLADEGFVGEIEQHCEGCKLTTVEVNFANASLIPSQTSSALLKNPNIDYVVVEFDSALQMVVSGIQKAGFTNKVTVASTRAELGSLQMLKDGGFLKAESGWSGPYQAWANADAIMRQMLGDPPPDGEVPLRLFTAENVDGLELTPDAYASGQWYGSDAYEGMFKQLWGVG